MKIKLLRFNLLTALFMMGVFVVFANGGGSGTMPILTGDEDEDEGGSGNWCVYHCSGTSSKLYVGVGQYIKMSGGANWGGISNVELTLEVYGDGNELAASYSSGTINVNGLIGRPTELGNTLYHIPLGVFQAANRNSYMFVYTLNINVQGRIYQISKTYTTYFDDTILGGGTSGGWTKGLRTASNIDQNTFVEKLTLYPNPTQGLLNVELPKQEGQATIRIFNAMGQEMNFSKRTSDGVKYEIDTQKLEAGVYFIRITKGSWSSQKRFIKL